MQAFGPITVVNFKLMEKCIHYSHIWHTHAPIWYNNNISNQEEVHHFSQEAGCRRAFIHWKILLVLNTC